MHRHAHPRAGETVRLRPGTVLNPAESVNTLRIEDWNDRVFGATWLAMDGHPASLLYAVRLTLAGLPIDNEVIYGTDERGAGHLVHASEIEAGEER